MADLRPVDSKVVREAAARLLPFVKGDFGPAGPPAPFQAITDDLLVVAEEAVASLCAAVLPKPLSLAAKQRLLTWLVADLRGATHILEIPQALVVGKRLERQALTVRDRVAEAAATAVEARDAARSSLTAGDALAQQLSEIDAAEKHALDAPKFEIYVGFHELDGLLPAADALAAAAPDTARVQAEAQPEPATIPPHVASLLGEEGCMELLKVFASSRLTSQESMLDIALPSLVCRLLRERVAAAEATMTIEAENDELRESASRKSMELAEVEDALHNMHIELKLANAKIESLHRVIRETVSVNEGQ